LEGKERGIAFGRNTDNLLHTNIGVQYFNSVKRKRKKKGGGKGKAVPVTGRGSL
jgi:hypothetical protein